MLRSGNYRDSRLDNAGFLMGDFFQGISQILHVIHCHIRNDWDDWKNDIGGVIKSSHAHFDNRIIHLFFAEDPEGHRCQQFKLSRSFNAFSNNLIGSFFDNSSRFCKSFLCHVVAAYIDAFRVVNQVRWHISAYFQLCIFQNAGNHGYHASFTVGAGNVDHLVSGFRISQFFQHGLYPFQSRLNAEGCCLFQIGHWFFVIHSFSIISNTKTILNIGQEIK